MPNIYDWSHHAALLDEAERSMLAVAEILTDVEDEAAEELEVLADRLADVKVLMRTRAEEYAAMEAEDAARDAAEDAASIIHEPDGHDEDDDDDDDDEAVAW